jgi:DNA-binding response OmpR family regulator
MKTLLIVEDDPAIRNNLAEMLHLEGFSVLATGSGSDAQRVVQSHPVDLLICDVRLPDLNGLHLLSNLRQNPLTANLPVIMVSGASQRSDIQQALALGADQYIVKPFQLDDLLNAVQRLLVA